MQRFSARFWLTLTHIGVYDVRHWRTNHCHPSQATGNNSMLMELSRGSGRRMCLEWCVPARLPLLSVSGNKRPRSWHQSSRSKDPGVDGWSCHTKGC